MSVRMQLVGMSLGAALALQGAALGEDFRIRTRLFEGDAKEPLSENTTVFRQGTVYDFLDEGSEVTVFDAGRGRFIILDRTKRQRTEIRTSELEGMVQSLRQKAAKKDQAAFLRFQADPEWDESRDEATGELVFSSPFMTYRVAAEAAPSEVSSQQWVDFSDWYARLNTAARQAPLPFPRILVNRSLGQRTLVPTKVRLTISQWGPLKDRTMRTEHQVIWQLNRDDIALVERTAQEIAEFKELSFTAFHERIGANRR